MIEHKLKKIISQALEEDLGEIGDISAESLLDDEKKLSAKIIAKQDGSLFGIKCAVETFLQVDKNLKVTILKNDGDTIKSGDVIICIKGSAKSLLIAERTALNFLGHLSGIATKTKQAVDIAKPYGTTIACTRKTTPLLRKLEKMAVASAGGSPHRFGLYDAVMIKDNHLLAVGCITKAIKIVKQAVLSKKINPKFIQVEVDTIEQLKQVLRSPTHRILLDNMSIDNIKLAVEMTNSRCLLEASGDITLDNLQSYAKCGVDIISMGCLTHSAKNFNFSMVFNHK